MMYRKDSSLLLELVILVHSASHLLGLTISAYYATNIRCEQGEELSY